MEHRALNPDERFDLAADLGSADQCRLHAALERKTGRRCVLRQAETAEAAERLREEARLVRHLEHPGLAQWIGVFEEGGRVTVAREAPPGRTLAELAAEGRKFTVSEAAAVLREAAGILGYLHSFFPCVAHGRLGPQTVAVGVGDRVWLLDPSGRGSPDRDVRALCEAVRAACSADAAVALSPLWLAGMPGSVGELKARLRRLDRAFAPPALKAPPAGPSWRRRLSRAGILIATLLGSFWVAVKVRFEWLPEWRARSASQEVAQMSREFRCGEKRHPPVQPGENLLLNPGIEGPCGWFSHHIRKGSLRKGGSHGGEFHLRLDAKQWVAQDMDLSVLEPALASGEWRIDLSAWMRGKGPGSLDVVAKRRGHPSEESIGFLASKGSNEWKRLSSTFVLPRDVRKLRVYLDGERQGIGWFTRAYFDDLELIVRPIR